MASVGFMRVLKRPRTHSAGQNKREDGCAKKYRCGHFHGQTLAWCSQTLPTVGFEPMHWGPDGGGEFPRSPQAVVRFPTSKRGDLGARPKQNPAVLGGVWQQSQVGGAPIRPRQKHYVTPPERACRRLRARAAHSRGPIRFR